MTTYIALLRGVNVGGKKKVAMGDLHEMLAGLGYLEPRTLLQSGNLVFKAESGDGAKVEAALETAARERLGFVTDFLVRNGREWKRLVEANPFPSEARSDPAHLVVVFLRKAPSADEVRTLEGSVSGPEVMRAEGKQLYAVYSAGIGTSRLTLPVIEKALGTRGTGRNWNTVTKLADLAGA